MVKNFQITKIYLTKSMIDNQVKYARLLRL